MYREVSLSSAREIPLVFDVDLLVVGNNLAGIAAAHRVARDNHRVALVTSATFLGHELAAWQRPWIEWRASERDLLTTYLPLEDLSADPPEGTLVSLHMDRLKRKLEDLLLDAGVSLLYASQPVALRREADTWLLCVGNKSGRQAIRARWLFDASDTGIVEHIADGRALESQQRPAGAAIARRTLEYTRVPGDCPRRLEVSRELGLPGHAIDVIRGAFSDDHVYVDIPIELDAPRVPSVGTDSELEFAARAKSLEVARYLALRVPAFSEAVLGLGSFQVMPCEQFDPTAALRLGCEFASQLLAGDLEPGQVQRADLGGLRHFTPVLREASPAGEAALACKEESEFAADWPGATVSFSLDRVEVLAESDVAVVGGGTSGASAAQAAARHGATTTLVEMNPALGGTGTLGSVKVYWMTYPNLHHTSPNALSDAIDHRVAMEETRLKYPTSPRIWVRRFRDGRDHWWGEDMMWSIEVKAQVLFEMCREAGAAVYFNSFCIGALVEGERLVGLLLATPYGPRALLADVTIDATGDGDVSAFAGAPFVYGSERDRLTMWSCLAGHRSPGSHGSHFTSAVDVADVLDYTRFVLASRRCGRDLHDHGIYIGPRETRHILGDVVVTLEDQIKLAHHPDTVAVMFSNYDMKGPHVADIVDFGLNPPHLDIEIPYRALLPRSLDQLLIAGKAFSLTHDASAAPRMQRDLQLLGAVMGLAGAQAIRDGVTVKGLDVAKLQRLLVESGHLPARVLDPPPPPVPPHLTELVRGLTGEEPWEWLEMLATERATEVPLIASLCLADREQVVPLLRSALPGSEGARRLLLSRLLLWHRCADGLPAVLQEIDGELQQGPGLPLCARDLWWVSGAPDHGVMPEVVHLLYALTRVRDERVLGPFEEVVTRLEAADRDYASGETRVFDYIRMVALAAERLVLPGFVPLLQRLLALPELAASVASPRLTDDHLEERKAILVLYLSRALARCGRKGGLLRLAGLLSDPRSLLARSALQELRALTGHTRPLAAEPWKKALENHPEEFPPMPWERELN